VNQDDGGNQAGGGGAPPPGNERKNHCATCYERARERGRRLGAFIEGHGPAIEAVSAAIIAVFTIAIFFTSKWSWQASTEQVRAARDAIAASRESVRALERPWLLFDPIPPEVPGHPEINGNYATKQQVGLFITNFGKSPAFRVRWALWTPEDPRPPMVADMPTPKRHWAVRSGHTVLAPGATMKMSSTWKGFPTHPIALDPGESVHILALIKYADIFKRLHRTLVCVEGQISNEKNRLENCYSHNDADY